MRRITLPIILLLLCMAADKAVAQTDALFSQYYQVPSYYNPAMTGATDYLNIRAGSRMQWVGVDGAPTTFTGLADMPFKLFGKRFGVGVKVMTEKIGLYNTLDFSAQLSYKFKKFGGEFSVGLGAGMYDQKFRGSEVFIPDDDDFHQSTDEAIPTQDIHGTALDLSAGLSYTHRLFYAGISCLHLTSPTVTMRIDGSETAQERNFEFKADRTLYFTAGSNIPIKNTLFELIPSVIVATDFNFTTAVITARARYRKMFTFGIGYRWDDAVYATLGAELKGFFIGYSYDYSTSAIAKASSGSHEVFAGYRLKLNLGEKNRNKHKSVRIM